MFAYISGEVAAVDAAMVVIDAGGVGYALNTSYQSARSVRVGENATFFTYLRVAENLFELYGFARKEELECFKQLLTVSGVGPKAALAVLGAIIAVFIISKIAAHWGDGYYSAGSDYYYKDGKTWYINSDFGWIDYEFVDEDYPVDFLGEEYSPEWPFNEFLQRADVDSLEELNGLDDDVITDDASEQD